MEKTKSELSVDLCQLKQQVSALKTDLHSEIEKVSDYFSRYHMSLQNVSVITSLGVTCHCRMSV